MKVYIVIEDFAYDGENGASVLGVYAEKENAKRKYHEMVEYIEKTFSYNTTDKGVLDYDTYNDGFYNEYHEHIYIVEKEVE